MQKDFPHELCYTALRDVKSELQPEFQRYTIDSSQSYFLYVEHRHPDHELIYVTQGKYRATLNGRELELEPGDALIICPGDIHLDAVHVGLKYHAVNFVLCSELNIGVSARLLKAGIAAGQQIIKLPSKYDHRHLPPSIFHRNFPRYSGCWSSTFRMTRSPIKCSRK
jgi:uncharacterized protein YjlB